MELHRSVLVSSPTTLERTCSRQPDHAPSLGGLFFPVCGTLPQSSQAQRWEAKVSPCTRYGTFSQQGMRHRGASRMFPYDLFICHATTRSPRSRVPRSVELLTCRDSGRRNAVQLRKQSTYRYLPVVSFSGGLQIHPPAAKPLPPAQTTKPLSETTNTTRKVLCKGKKKKKSQILPTSNNPRRRSALNNPTRNVTQAQ